MMEAATSCEVSVSIRMPNGWQDPHVYTVFFHSVIQTLIIEILSFKLIIT
jgi:hypothetical protein